MFRGIIFLSVQMHVSDTRLTQNFEIEGLDRIVGFAGKTEACGDARGKA